jgi:WbqC-like protein
MRLGVIQPYLFPYLGYFQLLHAVDRFAVYDDVAFIKRGWIHRNRLLINGESSLFTIPVRSGTASGLICEVLIDDRGKDQWSAKLLRTIDKAYRRAPEFGAVFPLVERVLDPGVSKIGELALRSIKAVAEFLDLSTTFVDSTTVYDNAELRGEARILDICRREGATDYINPSGGRHLYSASRFADQGVRLHFIVPTLPAYKQFGAAFVPGLSIIDVLMFNSRGVVREYLDQHSLD